MGQRLDSGMGMTNNGYTVAPVPTDAAGTRYYADDHLGTARMEFSSGGWPVWSGTFAPYGEEINPQATANNYKFTGKERDAESGNDYFGARYFASTMGRFISPDWAAKAEPVPYAKLDNPQSLNIYAYVLNNPLRFTDADGHEHNGCPATHGCASKAGAVVKKVKQWLDDHPKTVAVATAVATVALAVVTEGSSLAAEGAAAAEGAELGGAATEATEAGQAAETTAASGESSTAAKSGANYAGDNVAQGSGRVNSDLPGGQQAASDKFGELTQGQETRVDPDTGHTVSADGTRLRTAPDGTGRIERTANVTGGQHETIHFKTPGYKP